MKKYILMGKMNQVIKKRAHFADALPLWKSMIIKADTDSHYKMLFDHWLFNGGTLCLRALVEDFGDYSQNQEFIRQVDVINSASILFKQRESTQKQLNNVQWSATPDWEAYDGIELGSCYNEGVLEGTKDEHYVRFDDVEDFSPLEWDRLIKNNGIVHTLYGHLKEGGVEALYDSADVQQCRELATKVVAMNDWHNRRFDIADYSVET